MNLPWKQQISQLNFIPNVVVLQVCLISATRAFQSVDISSSDNVFGPEDYNLKAPISIPEKILCVGMNYVDHCTEQNIPVPTEPIIFSKFSSAITDPCAPVVKSDETEVELYIRTYLIRA